MDYLKTQFMPYIRIKKAFYSWVLRLLSLFQDNIGTIWTGTGGGGINKLEQAYFQHYTKFKENKNSISSKQVWSFFEDDNHICIGTRKGVNVLDQKNNKITMLFSNSHDNNKINSYSIWTIAKERKKNVYWLGTSRGIIRYD